jgi:hypothetical protein
MRCAIAKQIRLFHLFGLACLTAFMFAAQAAPAADLHLVPWPKTVSVGKVCIPKMSICYLRFHMMGNTTNDHGHLVEVRAVNTTEAGQYTIYDGIKVRFMHIFLRCA